MKIGQAIDEIFKDKSKIYQAIDEEGWRHTLQYQLEHRRVIMTGSFDHKYNTPLQEEFYELKWEEVKEPVSFMEAVKSGKRIRVEHKLVNDSDNDDLITFTSLDCLIYSLGESYNSTSVKEIIENGKWYIED